MAMKCDRCEKLATVHLIEIEQGQKIEKHLCEKCAAGEDVPIKIQQPPISELLDKFMFKHSAVETHTPTLRCGNCGMTYEKFRKGGLLGCPECYDAFGALMGPLLERAQEGATEHTGKVPVHAGVDELRQARVRRIRRELDQAVASEQYERAANLRDQLSKIEADKT